MFYTTRIGELMPEIGEEIRASDIGRGKNNKRFVWVICPVCREERWAHKASTLSSKSRLCKDCSIRAAAKRFHI